MDVPNTRRYEMLVRVSTFGTAHANLFPSGSFGGQMFAAVSEAAQALGEHASAEVQSRGAAGEAMRAKASIRARLETSLNVLRRTARALTLDTPGVDSKFRHPGRQSDRALVDTARAYSKDARTVAAALLTHGLPATFLDDLDANILAFQASIGDYSTSRNANATARAAISTALDAGLTAVQRLDAIVPNLLLDDPTTRAGWDRARQVERRSRVKKVAPKPSEGTAPPASDAPATAG